MAISRTTITANKTIEETIIAFLKKCSNDTETINLLKQALEEAKLDYKDRINKDAKNDKKDVVENFRKFKSDTKKSFLGNAYYRIFGTPSEVAEQRLSSEEIAKIDCLTFTYFLIKFFSYTEGEINRKSLKGDVLKNIFIVANNSLSDDDIDLFKKQWRNKLYNIEMICTAVITTLQQLKKELMDTLKEIQEKNKLIEEQLTKQKQLLNEIAVISNKNDQLLETIKNKTTNNAEDALNQQSSFGRPLNVNQLRAKLFKPNVTPEQQNQENLDSQEQQQQQIERTGLRKSQS